MTDRRTDRRTDRMAHKEQAETFRTPPPPKKKTQLKSVILYNHIFLYSVNRKKCSERSMEGLILILLGNHPDRQTNEQLMSCIGKLHFH